MSEQDTSSSSNRPFTRSRGRAPDQPHVSDSDYSRHRRRNLTGSEATFDDSNVLEDSSHSAGPRSSGPLPSPGPSTDPPPGGFFDRLSGLFKTSPLKTLPPPVTSDNSFYSSSDESPPPSPPPRFENVQDHTLRLVKTLTPTISTGLKPPKQTIKPFSGSHTE